MVTNLQFYEAASNVGRQILTWLPRIQRQKTDIQSRILSIATQQEMLDVRDYKINQGLIEKLCYLAHQHLSTDYSAENYYCLALSVATIIKEYDWGTQYLQNDALYELAQRINRQDSL